MTVLLVLGTFLVFIVLDYFLNRRKAIHTVAVEAPCRAAATRFGADYVEASWFPKICLITAGTAGWPASART